MSVPSIDICALQVAVVTRGRPPIFRYTGRQPRGRYWHGPYSFNFSPIAELRIQNLAGHLSLEWSKTGQRQNQRRAGKVSLSWTWVPNPFQKPLGWPNPRVRRHQIDKISHAAQDEPGICRRVPTRMCGTERVRRTKRNILRCPPRYADHASIVGGNCEQPYHGLIFDVRRCNHYEPSSSSSSANRQLSNVCTQF